MLQVIKVISFWSCITVFFSYRDKPDATKMGISKFLSGYRVLKEIKWGGDDLNSKDTGDIFRTASFKTLCFDTSGRFIYFASTQRRPRNYNDSLIFEGEPGVEVFKGKWSLHDTVVNVSYRIVYTGFTPVDSSEKSEKINIIYDRDAFLLFKNELYVRTLKYDKISQRTIEAYKKVSKFS